MASPPETDCRHGLFGAAELSQVGGGEFQEVPSLLAEAGGERVGVASGVLVDDADLMPVEQPQLRLPGRVEGQRPRVTDPEPFPSGAPLGRVVQHPPVAGEQVRETAVGDHHTLGRAGRSRGEDDIGRMIGAERYGTPHSIRYGSSRCQDRIVESVDDASRCRDAAHRGHPVPGCTRFDRQTGGTGVQHPEDRLECDDPAGQADRDDSLGADSVVGEATRDEPHPRVEVGEGASPVGATQRRRIRTARDHRVEQCREGRRRRGGPMQLT